MCQKVKTEQTGSSSVGLAIEKAMTSGNFAAAKQAMLNAYNVDAGNVQKALAVIKTAPSNVQAAFKNLLTFVQQIKTDIQNATSLQGLISSFRSLGTNQKLVADGTTIANWYTSVCGGTLTPGDDDQHPVAVPAARQRPSTPRRRSKRAPEGRAARPPGPAGPTRSWCPSRAVPWMGTDALYGATKSAIIAVVKFGAWEVENPAMDVHADEAGLTRLIRPPRRQSGCDHDLCPVGPGRTGPALPRATHLPDLRRHGQDPGGGRGGGARDGSGTGRWLRVAVVLVAIAVLAAGAALGLVKAGVIGNKNGRVRHERRPPPRSTRAPRPPRPRCSPRRGRGRGPPTTPSPSRRTRSP